jgi:hypothetical protein
VTTVPCLSRLLSGLSCVCCRSHAVVVSERLRAIFLVWFSRVCVCDLASPALSELSLVMYVCFSLRVPIISYALLRRRVARVDVLLEKYG